MQNKPILIVPNVRSILNVGSIFRTADAAGVGKIFLCGYTPTPEEHPEKISKTALGAEKFVEWEYQAQAWRVMEKLRQEGYQIFALEQAENCQNIFDFKIDHSKPWALVVGNEVEGMSENSLSRCDAILEIPMMGKKESLNVSVATGIALYELVMKNK
jgi:23S rRNA (guanosine2251-2'-O)-methyltransferase